MGGGVLRIFIAEKGAAGQISLRDTVKVFLLLRSKYTLCTCRSILGKKQVQYRMAIGNVEQV